MYTQCKLLYKSHQPQRVSTHQFYPYFIALSLITDVRESQLHPCIAHKTLCFRGVSIGHGPTGNK